MLITLVQWLALSVEIAHLKIDVELKKQISNLKGLAVGPPASST
jgi:hypothetical protein